MNYKKLFILLAAMGFVLVAGVAITVDGQAQEMGPLNAEEAIGSAFTYQGRLTDSSSGDPTAGPCDFEFKLYTASNGGSMVGSGQTINNVPLNNGYFSVELDFEDNAFQGEARYLAIAVACPGGGSLTPLSGRVKLTAAPYALGLMPGASIRGSDDDPILSVQNTGLSNGSTGVKGETSSIAGIGVYGINTNYSSGYGVYGTGFRGVEGYTNSSGGAGGFFRNMDTSAGGTSVGIWAGSYYGDIFQGHELDGSGNSLDRRFRITYDGNVYADGTYSSPAADFAEMLPAADDLEAGDVLEIGKDGELQRSSAANSRAVVGVYSTKPGFVGGAGDDVDGQGKVPLAVVGVVPVKVSAENGAIQPGDLLVASSIPGYAMRAGDDPAVGTVIGKALGGLENGTGIIQMLVTLQ